MSRTIKDAKGRIKLSKRWDRGIYREHKFMYKLYHTDSLVFPISSSFWYSRMSYLMRDNKCWDRKARRERGGTIVVSRHSLPMDSRGWLPTVLTIHKLGTGGKESMYEKAGVRPPLPWRALYYRNRSYARDLFFLYGQKWFRIPDQPRRITDFLISLEI